jgi:hypothetical protein
VSERPFVFVLRDKIASLGVDAIPSVERFVLLTIASYADPDGKRAFPSIAKIRGVTGHSVSRIVEAVKELADRGWLTTEIRFAEDGGRTSTGYTVALEGKTWPTNEGKAKRRAACRLPPGGRAATPSAPSTRPPIAPDAMHPSIPLTPLRETQGPIVLDARPPLRPTQGPIASDATYKPITNPSDKPIINPSGACAPVDSQQGDPQSQGEAKPTEQPSLFDLPKPQKPEVAKGDIKPPKKTKEPVGAKERAGDAYARAYLQGHAKAGGVLAPLLAGDKAMLGRVAQTFAVYQDGSKITGDELVAWFAKKAEDFRLSVPNAEHWRGGYSPFGFKSWFELRPQVPPLSPSQQIAAEEKRKQVPVRREAPPTSPELREKSHAIIRGFLERQALARADRGDTGRPADRRAVGT